MTRSASSRRLLLVPAALVASFVVALSAALAQTPAPAPTPPPPPGPTDTAQGQYLVSILGCRFCHGAQLQGLPLPDPNHNPDKISSPKIAGLPMFPNDEQALKFLETSLLPDGSRPRRPMITMRLKPSDATATLAYLRSLK